MYKVIEFFRDLQDNNHAYHVGDTFPHGRMAVSEDRIKELSTDANRRHKPLIALVEDKPKKSEEPVEGFMNPPEEPDVDTSEEKPVESVKPKKKRGRPKNDA